MLQLASVMLSRSKSLSLEYSWYIGSMAKKGPASSLHYILLNKPYGVLSQFTREGDRQTLSDFGPFPSHVYAAGRLDADSEGLLLLTNDTKLNHRLTEPRFGHPRTYLVQIERQPDERALQQLRKGVMIEGKMTRPADVRLCNAAPDLPPRSVPIRYRRSVPTAWIEMTLTEGRNRQVRKMTAAVGHPTLRMVRIRIGPLTIGALRPGAWRRLNRREILAVRATVGLGVQNPVPLHQRPSRHRG
jgi:23S rRNA pseudouridine2457 synthase